MAVEETPVKIEKVLESNVFSKFTPFWLFLIFYKFAGGLYYALGSTLGEKLFPLWVVGVIVGVCAFIELLLDVPAGHILDKYGYIRFLKVTTVIFLVAAVCLLFGLTKTTYLISMGISILGWTFFGPGINAYIFSHAPKEHTGMFISLRDVFGSLGIVFSCIALIYVIELPVPYIGYILALLFFIAFAMLFFSPPDYRLAHQEIKIPIQEHYIRRTYVMTLLKAIKKLNPASTMLLLLNLTGALFYGVIWFVVPLVIAHQAQEGILGIGLATFDLSIVVLGYVLGNLADKANKRVLVFFGLLIFAVSGMILGFNFGWIFIIVGFLSTAGDEMASIALWAWMYTLDKDHMNDGLISGIIKLFEDLGWAIGPMIAGVTYELVGPSYSIVIGAVPIFIVWIVYQIMMHAHKPYTIFGDVETVPHKPHRRRIKA